jgi:hypothetical protein
LCSFCTVIINKQFIHFSPSSTLGNHQCNGAAPIFINSGVARKIYMHCNSSLKKEILPFKSIYIQSNNKYGNSSNMNWSMASGRPIHSNGPSSNSSILRILHHNTINNKVLRYMKRIMDIKLSDFFKFIH